MRRFAIGAAVRLFFGVAIVFAAAANNTRRGGKKPLFGPTSRA